MPKASLLSDEDRDQLLKEMAFGIPMEELTNKYHLKPIQIEYQRGNNSSLYNFYVDYFCIKPEILEWEESDLFRFILNILYDKVKKVSYKDYEYKGKLYKVYELIPEVNRILTREGLPTIALGQPVRIRYTNRRMADQQIDKSEMPDIIRKMKLHYTNIFKNKKEFKKFHLVDALNQKKRVNWKYQLSCNTGAEDLACLRCWYRLWTEGKNRQKGGKISDMHILLKYLYEHNLLENNYFDILPSNNPKSFKILELKKDFNKSDRFMFNGFQYMEKLETFINRYCIGLPLQYLPVCINLALNTDKKVIDKLDMSIKRNLVSYFSFFEDLTEVDENITLDEICNFLERA